MVARPVANEARLLGPGDHGTQELARRVAVLEVEPVRDDARGAQVLGEALHEEVERAGDEDHVVPLGPGALDQVARARVDGALDHRVERLVGEDEESVARDALVIGKEELIEPPPVDHFCEDHPRAPERRPRQSAEAAKGGRLVGQIEDGRVQQVRMDEGAVDVEKAGGH